MVRQGTQRIIGGIFLFIGVTILLNSFSGITGFVVFEGTDVKFGFYAAVWFFVSGILLFTSTLSAPSYTRHRESRLERLFVKDRKNVVRINDFKGNLINEGLEHLEPAHKALKDIGNLYRNYKEDFGKPEAVKLFRTILEPYIEAARLQIEDHAGQKVVKGTELYFVNKFLRIWDHKYNPLVHERVIPVLDKMEGKGYLRVRHYTTSSRADKINKVKVMGWEGSPRPLDQGKVFVELASNKILSQQEFIERHVINNPHLGESYVEFLVPENDIKAQTNPKNGLKEYYLDANSIHGKNPSYKIYSNVKVTKRA